MIRINLFNGLQLHPARLDIVRRVLVITACTISGALVVGLTVLLIRTVAGGSSAPAPVPAPTSAATTIVTRIPYRSLPLAERLAYEILFANRLLNALRAAIPPDMTPSHVTIDSFEVLRVEGQTRAKEHVTTLLSALRTEDLKLAPKPETRVTLKEDGSYEYAAVSRASFPAGQGAETADSVLAELPSPADYATHVKRFERLAAETNVNIRSGLRFVAAQKAGVFRRYVYRMEAAATLDQVVRLVRALRDNKVSCAVATARIMAGRFGRMDIDAELYFIARE